MQFGCCTSIKHYCAVKEAGYGYMEISGDELTKISQEEFTGFLELYSEWRFPCYAINDFASAPLALVGDGWNENSWKRYMKKLLQRASALDVKMIAIGAPACRQLPESYPRNRANQQFVSFLHMAGALAESYDIQILIEPLHEGVCQYVNYVEDAVELAEEVNRCNVAVVLDFFHAWKMHEAIEKLEKAMPYVKHLHISSITPEGTRCYLNKTNLECLEDVYRFVVQSNYQGNMSIEIPAEAFDAKKAKINLELFKEMQSPIYRSPNL